MGSCEQGHDAPKLNQVIAIIPRLRVVLNRRSVASMSWPMVKGPGAFDVS